MQQRAEARNLRWNPSVTDTESSVAVQSFGIRNPVSAATRTANASTAIVTGPLDAPGRPRDRAAGDAPSTAGIAMPTGSPGRPDAAGIGGMRGLDSRGLGHRTVVTRYWPVIVI